MTSALCSEIFVLERCARLWRLLNGCCHNVRRYFISRVLYSEMRRTCRSVPLKFVDAFLIILSCRGVRRHFRTQTFVIVNVIQKPRHVLFILFALNIFFKWSKFLERTPQYLPMGHTVHWAEDKPKVQHIDTMLLFGIAHFLVVRNAQEKTTDQDR